MRVQVSPAADGMETKYESWRIRNMVKKEEFDGGIGEWVGEEPISKEESMRILDWKRKVVEKEVKKRIG